MCQLGFAQFVPETVEGSTPSGTATLRVLRCTMCDGEGAHLAADSRGLLQHTVRMHLGQLMPAETIAQLRELGTAF